MSNYISDLIPSIQNKAYKFLNELNTSQELKKLGVEKVVITETKRDLYIQMAYYSRGRMQPCDVKAMYKAAGLYEPTEQECKTPNTQTLQSKHIEGKALDVVPVQNSKLWWSAPKEVWDIIGNIGIKNGFTWGGSWEWKDYPHFQI